MAYYKAYPGFQILEDKITHIGNPRNVPLAGGSRADSNRKVWEIEKSDPQKNWLKKSRSFEM